MKAEHIEGSLFHVCFFLLVFQALKVRQADVTRETVQKSVCVLSRVVSQSLDDLI